VLFWDAAESRRNVFDEENVIAVWHHWQRGSQSGSFRCDLQQWRDWRRNNAMQPARQCPVNIVDRPTKARRNKVTLMQFFYDSSLFGVIYFDLRFSAASYRSSALTSVTITFWSTRSTWCCRSDIWVDQCMQLTDSFIVCLKHISTWIEVVFIVKLYRRHLNWPTRTIHCVSKNALTLKRYSSEL